MLLVGTITYVAQRDASLDRVDEQLESAIPALRRELVGRGRVTPFHGRRRPAAAAAARRPTRTASSATPSGEVIKGEFLGPDDSGEAPDLPAELPRDETRHTVGGYRVLAVDGRDGTTTVAAISMDATNESLGSCWWSRAIVIIGVLALVGGFALVVVRVGLLPLDRMGHTASAIAGGDLSHRVETTDPRTEVGRLGIALNRMLDRLEDAFAAREASQERLRRFIADASHELRTPLVSIRGYAELYRMGAARSDEDVAKSMRRIEDEAARMGVLVEDLLTLARLDEVRAAPHGPVDLAALARDAVDDARVTAPDREISLDAEPARVTGDADQLRQVLANLLRNALVHTPAGTPIEVTVDDSVRARGPRPRPRPADRRLRRALRTLLARRGRPRARQGRRRPRPRDRGRDRRRPRRHRLGREPPGRRSRVRGPPPSLARQLRDGAARRALGADLELQRVRAGLDGAPRLERQPQRAAAGLGVGGGIDAAALGEAWRGRGCRSSRPSGRWRTSRCSAWPCSAGASGARSASRRARSAPEPAGGRARRSRRSGRTRTGRRWT